MTNPSKSHKAKKPRRYNRDPKNKKNDGSLQDSTNSPPRKKKKTNEQPGEALAKHAAKRAASKPVQIEASTILPWIRNNTLNAGGADNFDYNNALKLLRHCDDTSTYKTTRIDPAGNTDSRHEATSTGTASRRVSCDNEPAAKDGAHRRCRG